ncbi:hypothetical protein, partial [Salmonella enterica]|uniref:hypothetical protein n=1 Tax=Salmonella enterica TaxID=28901 RepID=UPI0020C34B22
WLNALPKRLALRPQGIMLLDPAQVDRHDPTSTNSLRENHGKHGRIMLYAMVQQIKQIQVGYIFE